MKPNAFSGRSYLLTYLGLMALSALTFALSFAPLGRLHLPVAMLVAAAKGTLIAFVFMHLAEEGSSNRIAFLVGIILLVVLIALTVGDVVTRHPALVPPTGA